MPKVIKYKSYPNLKILNISYNSLIESFPPTAFNFESLKNKKIILTFSLQRLAIRNQGDATILG